MFYHHDTKNDENVSPNFENGVKKGTVEFFYGKPYNVTYHWKGILESLKILK